MAATSLKMTADEFLDYAATHGRCELIEGEVRHLSPAGGRHGNVGARLLGFISIAPDLVAEAISPSDSMIGVNDKVGWWLRHGVRLVWVVDPMNSLLTIFRPDGSGRVLSKGDTLDGGEVLPQFRLPLADLFR